MYSEQSVSELRVHPTLTRLDRTAPPLKWSSNTGHQRSRVTVRTPILTLMAGQVRCRAGISYFNDKFQKEKRNAGRLVEAGPRRQAPASSVT
ncbi:hypothetical protein BaRGS_00030802 [Batillaria attramentaria]|uniref:Uncharacterized protein n=1 Tax=Batillaria attramentaria TaxID=370345 RepID=A0ABD0JTY4_9CAEN